VEDTVLDLIAILGPTGRLRGIVLASIVFLAGYGSAQAQSYDALAAKFGASYYVVRASDVLLERCSPVPVGDAVATTNGKKVTWDGVGPIKQLRETCQNFADGKKREIREAYPTKVSAFERDLAKEIPGIDADVRAGIQKATKDMREDERIICVILRGGLVHAAEKNCKP
jgi:hypothetical protein